MQQTELIAKGDSAIRKLCEGIECVRSGYMPSFWASLSPRFCALATFFAQYSLYHEYFREVVNTPDGGQIAIDWVNLGSPKRIIVLILSGLSGTSKENYLTHIVHEAGKTMPKDIQLL